MSTARDTGLAALQNGDTQTAITQLETAIQQDPTDFQAHLYLGGAYGHAGRHMDAINILTTAVRLEPASAQARYNLGIAMDEGGYRDQAIAVLQQALQLQPDYPRAQEALNRIQNSSAHGNDGFGAPMSATPTSSNQTTAMEQPQSTAYGQPAQGYSPPGQAAPTYAPPGATTQMPASAMPPGQAQTLYGQPPAQSEPGLGSYSAPPPAKPFAQPGYGAPGAGYASPGMNPYPSLPAYDDGFNIGRAFSEWFRAMFTPVKLFSEMAGCSTNSSTWALFVVYMLAATLVTLIVGVVKGTLGMSVITLLLAPVFYVILWGIFAGIVHMFSRAFGSAYTYGCSYRAVVYSAAPWMMIGLIGNILIALMTPTIPSIAATNRPDGYMVHVQDQSNPFTASPKRQPGRMGGPNQFGAPNQFGSPNQFGQPGQTTSPFGSRNASPFGPLGMMSPVVLLVFIFGMFWGMIVLGLAVQNIHQISGGAAAGVVILSVIVFGIVFVGICIVLGMIFGLAIAGMMGSSMPH